MKWLSWNSLTQLKESLPPTRPPTPWSPTPWKLGFWVFAVILSNGIVKLPRNRRLANSHPWLSFIGTRRTRNRSVHEFDFFVTKDVMTRMLWNRLNASRLGIIHGVRSHLGLSSGPCFWFLRSRSTIHQCSQCSATCCSDGLRHFGQSWRRAGQLCLRTFGDLLIGFLGTLHVKVSFSHSSDTIWK